MKLPKPKLDRKSALNLWCTEHSEYAKEQMVLCNQGIIGYVLKKMGSDPSDEDLFSAGMIGLVKAINLFDADKGFAFTTFAVKCIHTEMLMVFRKKKVPIAFYLDDKTTIGNGEEVCYYEMFADDREFEEEVITNKIFSEFKELLSDEEKVIIKLYLNDKTQKEIGEILNISQASVSRVLKKCQQKYKSRFMD